MACLLLRLQSFVAHINFSDDGGWSLHVVSTASEWIMAMAFDIFLLSLVPEFRKLVLESPRICIRIDPSASLLEINSSFEDYASPRSLIT